MTTGDAEHPNATAYRQAAAAFRAGDIEAIEKLVDPDVDVSTRVVSIFHFSNGRQIERWFYPEDMGTWNNILGAS